MLLGGIGAAIVAIGFAFTGAPGADVLLDRQTDSIALGSPLAIDRHKLERDVTARAIANGASLPMTFFIGPDGNLRGKAASTYGPYNISVGGALTDNLGRHYGGPNQIHVGWRVSQPSHKGSRGRQLMVGVNANSSPQAPATISGWSRDLGVGFVRQGWSSADINPYCKPESEYEDWQWKYFDQKMDAYQSDGLKILLVPLQFNTAACGNGGSRDTRLILDSPERYGEYVEGVLRHVFRRNPGLVIAVELGNEPDVDHFWLTPNSESALKPNDATAYYGFLKAGSSAAVTAERATGQHVVVMNGGYGMANLGWWKDLIHKPGLGDLVDALSIHIYPWAGAPPAAQPPEHNSMETVLAEMEIVRNSAVAGKPIWITELGLQVSPNCPWAIDENGEADSLVNLMNYFNRKTEDNIRAVAWFTLQDDNRVRDNVKLGDCYASQGLGLIDDSGRKRPAYFALKRWATIDRQSSGIPGH